MKVLIWTPDFKPEQETSIVPVWILVHKLPWHLLRWDIISRLVQSIFTIVAPDQTTYPKTRGNMTKVNQLVNTFNSVPSDIEVEKAYGEN